MQHLLRLLGLINSLLLAYDLHRLEINPYTQLKFTASQYPHTDESILFYEFNLIIVVERASCTTHMQKMHVTTK